MTPQDPTSHPPLRPRSRCRALASSVYRSRLPTAMRERAIEPVVETVRDGVVTLHRKIRQHRSEQTVLLLADTLLNLEVVLELWESLSDEPRLRSQVSVPRSMRHVARAMTDVPVRRSLWRVRWRWWDLVLCANHIRPFPVGVPVVLTPHGLASSGKRLRGEDVVYGPRRSLRRDGSPIYTRMFESNEDTRASAIRRIPALAGTIVVVGSLRLDVLRQQGHADGEPGVRHVGVCSTFGPNSLLERCGVQLLDEVERLAADRGWHFVLFSHPNLWSVHGRIAQPWDERLRSVRSSRIEVVEPGCPPGPLISQLDVMVSDHTSMSFAPASMGIPVVFLRPPPGVVEPDGLASRLMAAGPEIAAVDELEEAVDRAVATGQTVGARAIARSISAHPGEAAERSRSELLALLGRSETEG